MESKVKENKEKKSRMLKGSPEALEFGAKMKLAKSLKKAEREKEKLEKLDKLDKLDKPVA